MKSAVTDAADRLNGCLAVIGLLICVRWSDFCQWAAAVGTNCPNCCAGR
jgi:hypothetical protein